MKPHPYSGSQGGSVVSHTSKVAVRRARLLLGWVTYRILVEIPVRETLSRHVTS